ncbi:MAG: bifunctional UDP-sugar hydrolase/5'-nucleotidase [Coriobacteriales bacterium]|nr:bifunctional UDP-sugar hydrolase/5'-nucleotidase [Coriobacteriales bacterium]
MLYNNLHPLVSRRTFLRGLGLMSASAALAACGQTTGAGQTTTEAPAPLLAIIHTNDTHGHDVAVEGTDDTEGNFSMAAVAALKTEWEKKGYEVLIVDAGDATQGMPLVDTTKGMPAMAFMNGCGYELMAVGNHEFDWGVEALAANEETANFPFLSANVVDKVTGEPRFVPNKIVELTDGTKVGFFGLTTPSTKTTTSPRNVEGFTFLSGDELIACAQAQVDELRGQGCDMVIAVAHLGNDAIGGDQSKGVLEQVTGIDLFIDGHDHEEVQEEVNGVLLVETGCYLHNIGVVAIDEGVPSDELVAAGTFDGIDASVQAIIDDENQRVEDQMNVVLGATAYFLDGNREPGVRTMETNLGDFCADAYRWTSSQELGYEVDAAIINGGAIRSSIEVGDITLGIIKSVQPFGNDLGVVKVTGAQLLEALEAGCQAIGTESALGGFPQVSGIRYTIDASMPFEEGPLYPDSSFHSPAALGARVTIHDVGGRAFDEGDTYSIAMSTFLCQGGDTYYAFKAAAEAEWPQTFCFDYEALVSYLVEGCNYEVPAEYENPQGQGRITIVGV